MPCGSRPINRPADWDSVSPPSFADACDSGVGLNGDHHIALVNSGFGIWWQVGSHSRDLHFRKAGESGQSASTLMIAVAAQRTEKGPSYS